MSRHLVTGAVILCLTGAADSSALAQAPVAERPSGGLFGSRREGTTGPKLDLSATLVQAYDDNLLAESGSISPGSPTLSGHYTALQTGSYFAWAGKNVQFGLTGASAFRYYSSVGEVQAVGHSGGVGLSASLARRTTLAINQEAAYSPSYMFGLFPGVDELGPGEARPLAPDYAVNDRASRSYASKATITHGLTRRASISTVADYASTHFLREEDGRRDMTTYGVRTTLSRSAGRHSAVRAGYRYRAGDLGAAATGSATSHGIEFGMDHSRVLSASRRADLGFGLGVSTIDAPTDRFGAEARGRFYQVLADATLRYQFGRSWQARAAYRRGLEFVAQLNEPVFVGGFSASVGGLLSRRVDLLASASYSSGESALHRSSTFDTYTGSVRSRAAITQSVAVYLEYLYYFYDFGGNSLIAPGLSPRLERNGVRAGLTLWVPVFRR